MPKRILSLDGGGIRGVLTLQFLDRIEAMLRNRTGIPDLVLCDYFDLIGGTSTGSIIAAALACGFSVARYNQRVWKWRKGGVAFRVE
jgi:patatin-like phospholipase/acyl hydrolase